MVSNFRSRNSQENASQPSEPSGEKPQTPTSQDFPRVFPILLILCLNMRCSSGAHPNPNDLLESALATPYSSPHQAAAAYGCRNIGSALKQKTLIAATILLVPFCRFASAQSHVTHTAFRGTKHAKIPTTMWKIVLHALADSQSQSEYSFVP